MKDTIITTMLNYKLLTNCLYCKPGVQNNNGVHFIRDISVLTT